MGNTSSRKTAQYANMFVQQWCEVDLEHFTLATEFYLALVVFCEVRKIKLKNNHHLHKIADKIMKKYKLTCYENQIIGIKVKPFVTSFTM